MMFIICIQHDNESENLHIFLAIYTCVLYTDGMIRFMHVCVLLAIYSILPYWIIVCAML